MPASLVADMLDDFRAKGTFGEVGNFLAGKDEHFGLGDWWRVFRTVPPLRRYLALALLWNAVAKRRPRTGYSEQYLPGRKYNFSYRTFCTDFLVWESIAGAASHFGLSQPSWVSAGLQDYFGLARANCYQIEYRGRSLPMFSYYPRRDHLVDPGNEVHRLFFSRDDNVPDIDTTCLILGSWLSLIRGFRLPGSAYLPDERETLDLVSLMADHVRGEGEYGRGGLSYDNGIRPDDQGVLTWVFDRYNELDPTSNVNILNFLFQIRRLRTQVPESSVDGLAHRILRFLLNHAEDGTYLDQRFQSYYPLGPSLYFWRRLRITWQTLDPIRRERLDPDRAMDRIHGRLLEDAGKIFASPLRGYHDFDFLTAAPLLFEAGLLREKIRAWMGDGLKWREYFLHNHFEIFHLRYPSKIICAPIRFPFACLLDLLAVMDGDTEVKPAPSRSDRGPMPGS